MKDSLLDAEQGGPAAEGAGATTTAPEPKKEVVQVSVELVPALRNCIAFFTAIGFVIWLVALARNASVVAASLAPTVTPFDNWYYWCVLFAAPVTGWFGFRRVYHNSLPWFAAVLAVLSYMVLDAYTVRVSSQRQHCTTEALGSPNRRNCDMVYLGYTGAFFIFSSQILLIFITTVSGSDTPTSYSEVISLFQGARSAVRGEGGNTREKKDIFLRVSVLFLSFGGFLLWIIELGFYSNATAAAGGTQGFANWYYWVALWAAPVLVLLSYMDKPHRTLPFLAVIVTAVLFDANRTWTGETSACSAQSREARSTSTDCKYTYVGMVGVLIMFFSQFCFIGVAANDVYSEAEYEENSKVVKGGKIAGFILTLIGCLLWLILLGKSAQWVAYTNNQDGSACTTDTPTQCLFWYEWTWWFLLCAMPLTALIMVVSSKARPSVPFFTALFMALMYYASQVYTSDQGNQPSGQVGVYGIQSCRVTIAATDSGDVYTYCAFVGTGFAGIVMLVVAMGVMTFVNGGALTPPRVGGSRASGGPGVF